MQRYLSLNMSVSLLSFFPSFFLLLFSHIKSLCFFRSGVNLAGKYSALNNVKKGKIIKMQANYLRYEGLAYIQLFGELISVKLWSKTWSRHRVSLLIELVLQHLENMQIWKHAALWLISLFHVLLLWFSQMFPEWKPLKGAVCLRLFLCDTIAWECDPEHCWELQQSLKPIVLPVELQPIEIAVHR